MGRFADEILGGRAGMTGNTGSTEDDTGEEQGSKAEVEVEGQLSTLHHLLSASIIWHISELGVK